jgi:hypothetical protein
MKAVSLNDIKLELQHLSQKETAALCLRMARYKKENKELLAYHLFNAHDIHGYTSEIKESISEDFNDVNNTDLHRAKKILRKIIRQINKQVRFTLNKQTEAELRIHFCLALKASGMPVHKNKALNNMYVQQVKKIKTALAGLHEDIQYDLMKQVEEL